MMVRQREVVLPGFRSPLGYLLGLTQQKQCWAHAFTTPSAARPVIIATMPVFPGRFCNQALTRLLRDEKGLNGQGSHQEHGEEL